MDRSVGLEHEEQGVLGGDEGVGQLGAAEPPHDLLVGGVAVIDHNVVIGALLMRL